MPSVFPPRRLPTSALTPLALFLAQGAPAPAVETSEPWRWSTEQVEEEVARHALRSAGR